MALISNTLFGQTDKVEQAIARLKEFAPPHGYYVAFSGGKDSVVLLDLVRRSGVLFDYHFNLTTVDPPELIYFIKENYPDVIIEQPKMSMWKLIVNRRFPPTRRARYCCQVLKESSGSGRVCLTGVRWEESHKRSTRKMVEICYTDTTKKFVHPIIDWTSAEIWQYIRERNLRYCLLYDEGFNRIGCIMCPLAGIEKMKKDAVRWPKFAAAYTRAFEKTVAKAKIDSVGRTKPLLLTKFADGDALMKWWITEPGTTNYADMGNLFE